LLSEPSPRADDVEGKVAAVSSAHEPMAVTSQLWDLLHDVFMLELVLVMGAAETFTLLLGAIGAVGSWGCKG
jgi:hypothetical protein